MAKIDRLLSELAEDARHRVVDWIVGRQNQKPPAELFDK